MEAAVIERLAAKSPEEAIIEQISRDFNLAPFMARTQFKQMQQYFGQYYDLKREVGQITYLAVSAGSPPGRAVGECERVAVNLSLDHPEDLEAWGEGVAKLRQSKIKRLTREAQEQGGLLSQEDLARLLCASRSTIKRDIGWLREQGVDVPTRGQVKDIGKGVSHKSQIVGDWLAGYSFSQIKTRRWHSIAAIERYCNDFQRVVRLHRRGLSLADIRLSTGLSERLLEEYLSLYKQVAADPGRLEQLLAEPSPSTQTPAEIKRGAWLT